MGYRASWAIMPVRSKIMVKVQTVELIEDAEVHEITEESNPDIWAILQPPQDD